MHTAVALAFVVHGAPQASHWLSAGQRLKEKSGPNETFLPHVSLTFLCYKKAILEQLLFLRTVLLV